jgi:hypothetical protein
MAIAPLDPMESFEVNEYTDLRPDAVVREREGFDFEFETYPPARDVTVDSPEWEEVKL